MVSAIISPKTLLDECGADRGRQTIMSLPCRTRRCLASYKIHCMSTVDGDGVPLEPPAVRVPDPITTAWLMTPTATSILA